MLYAFLAALLTFITVVIGRTLILSSKSKITPIFHKIPVEIDDAVERLSKAIRFKTVSRQDKTEIDGNEFQRMHEFLEESFPHVHEYLNREIINDFSLLFTWKGADPGLKPMMLTCHLDVVPVEPGTEQDWEHPPFQGKVADNYIWGRGTMDVQSGVMAILESVEALLKQGYKPERTIYLGFGHDEEIDGHYGARAIGRLLEERGVELEFLLDEGLPVVEEIFEGVKSPVALVAVAEKGYLSLELTSESDGGHSSVPQGKTSIAKLSEAVNKLENNHMPAKIDGLTRETFASLCTSTPFYLKVIFANIWLFKGVMKRFLTTIPATDATLRTTTATTIFESGVKDNVIPTVAKSIINFRIHPNDTVQDVINHVKKTIKDPEIKIKPIKGYINPSIISDVNSEAYKKLEMSVRQIFPEVAVTPSLMVGATDARHYSHLTNNIYRFFPLRAEREDLDRVHGTNERLSIDNYAEMIQFYARVILNAASEKPDHNLIPHMEAVQADDGRTMAG